MAEDERTEEPKEVEAHGVKEVAGVGLAAAALIGAGAAGVKYATDDDKSRNQAALVAEDAQERLAKADADGDGYVNYRELANVDMKFSPAPMNAEGTEVTAEALAAAGVKIELEDIGREDGYQLERNVILLKYKVDEEVDKLAMGPAMEWASKHKEMDGDGDGYATPLELDQAGYKFVVALDEATYKEYEPKELEAAGVKFNLAELGEGGFPVQDNLVMHKEGIDERLDAFIKGE